jgi:hypothetical protein
MRKQLSFTTMIAALALAACGGNDEVEPGNLATGDSLVPIADEAMLPDTMPPAPPETVYTERPAPRPAPPPAAPRPSPPPAAAPAPAPAPAPVTAARSISSGTTIRTTMIDSVHSRVTRPGDQVRVRVANDVNDSQGRVVIPAGAVVTLAVTEVAPAGSKGGAGTLTMVARSVTIDGESKAISARATDFEYQLKGRGVGTGEVAKTAGGAAAGAIIGRVIGGRSATVIGAIGGAAAGAAVADATQDRDVVLAAGSPVTLTLNDEFEI